MKKFIVGIITYAFILFNSIQIASAADNKSWVYVVTDGDNLWNITTKFLTKIDYYTKLQQLNNIKHPRKMKPGSVIRIPMEWIKHTPASARILFIQGTNQFLRNNVKIPLTSSSTLVLGDEIRTGDKSSVTVQFADGSEMVLFENTIVSFDHLSAYGETGMVDTRVRVIQGKVETNAKKNKGPGSRLDISTPSAISSVRGTVYRVSNTGKNISTVEVIEGTVAVAGEQPNNTIKVATGQGTRIEKGLEPTKPVPLLSAPNILTKQTFFEKAPQIKWGKNEKAKHYNVQVSANNKFKSIIWSQSTPDTSIELPKFEDGQYYYRITATDNLGIEGIPANKKFTLNLSPKAPELIDTPERILGDIVFSTLQWAPSVDSVDSYQLEIAKDTGFKQPVLNKKLSTTEFELPTELAFGNYYWRVSSIQGNDKGPASSPLAFNWITLIAAPSCDTTASSDSINITWSPITKNQTITIEIAQDKEFTKRLKTYQFGSDISNVQYDTNEEVFIRCKTNLSGSEIESQWSKTQHISHLDEGILSFFGFLLLVILI